MTISINRALVVRVAVVAAIALTFILLMLRDQTTSVQAVAATGSPVSGKCVGGEQGVIKGDVTLKGREGTYAITALNHTVKSPRDTATGQSTGRRQHQPLIFTMNVSQAAPKLLNAMADDETLTKCTFNFYKAGLGGGGAEKNYFRIVLTNAQITDYAFSGRPGGQDTVSFSMSYQNIEWTYLDGNITAEDGPLID